MRFGILGPLLVQDGDAGIQVAAARQRVLLAALVLHAGQAVAADVLAETVWDGSPPAGAAGTLRTHVMRLRQVLGPRAGTRVVTRYPGYLLDAAEEEVDLLRFTSLYRGGGAAFRTGAWAQASGMLSEGLRLWRGAPLADIRSRVLQGTESPHLEQLRLQAVEWRIDAELHLGSGGELVPELQRLVADHPLRERFHAQLLLALYQSGRQGDALAAYQHARQVLIDELGAEPGIELRGLHQRILAADPALAAPAPAHHPVPGPPPGPAPVVPRQLPAPVRHFIGRKAELAALNESLNAYGGQAREAVVISLIGGTAGVGKTALAVHWAHQVAPSFPDGQLYVNLRGYDPGPPMPAADALAGFLRALGVAGQDIPPQTDERAARYRSLLAGRQMLVVLDNASSVQQVRPLLPGTSASVAVVTSRDSLAGLVARDGAERLEVDLLPLPDALGLLRALIGGRVEADPDAAAALAAQCSCLPLALRVAAELAAARPAVRLADLASELADQRHRLELLDAGGDPGTAVRAVFSWSYRRLDPEAAAMFRLAGLHPGADFDSYAAAALTDATLDQAERVLDQLARAHLIQVAGPGRHGLHDLLKAYARLLAASHDGQDGQLAALIRLFDHYLGTAAVAMDTLFPAERHRRPVLTVPASPAPALTSQDAARAWLDGELANLVAVIALAVEHRSHSHAIRLATTLFRYLDVAGCHSEAHAIYSQARRAAAQAGDRAAEAEALTCLGVASLRQGRYQEAVGQFQQSLAMSREAGDRACQARALMGLGGVHQHESSLREAADDFRQAVALFRQVGDQTGQARALANLGGNELTRGCYQQAIGDLRRAQALFREAGDRFGEAHVLINLGVVGLRQDRCQQAAGDLRQALVLFREAGNRYGEATATADLGLVDVRLGRPEQAVGQLRQALALFREIGEQYGEAGALNGLGEAEFAAGRSAHARIQHAAALDLAIQINDRYEQARAHNGLAHGHQATGDTGQARCHWQEALAIYTDLGAAEADQVRAQLAAASDEGHDGPAD